jgi:periplasmic protein TonB
VIRRARQRPRPRRPLPAPPPGPANVTGAVFTPPPGKAGRRAGIAGAAALAVYGAIGAWAVLAPPRPSVAAPPPPELPVELVELPAPAPPPPSPPPPPPRARPPDRAPPEAPAPTPAQAAEVVTREPAPDEPLDLTSFTVASGQAERHAGGKTAANGTSTGAVTGAVDPRGVANGTGTGVDRSRPVRPRANRWDGCPWPAEAEALGIDEQAVTIRVVVTADGQVESVELVTDPGHGFGAQALSCARESPFDPALDAEGRAVRARSGPLRVRFTR